MAVNGERRNICRLFACYQAIVAGVCLALLPARPLPFAVLAAVHGTMVVVLQRAADSGGPGRTTRRGVLWPWGLWLLSWVEIGRVIAWADLVPRDARIVAADLAVFGVHLHEVAGAWPVLDEVMQGVYLSYYLLVLGPLAVFLGRDDRRAAASYTLAAMAAYLVCFAVYLFHPVLGPRAAAAVAAAPAEGAMAGWAEELRRLGDSPGTAFPSSHCAGSLAAALAAGRHVARPWRWVLVLWALLIAASTVVTGNHYAIDAICGLAVALGIHLVLGRRPGTVTGREGIPCDRS
jgi:membrane-associated phospholipid phosphatase